LTKRQVQDPGTKSLQNRVDFSGQFPIFGLKRFPVQGDYPGSCDSPWRLSIGCLSSSSLPRWQRGHGHPQRGKWKRRRQSLAVNGVLELILLYSRLWEAYNSFESLALVVLRNRPLLPNISMKFPILSVAVSEQAPASICNALARVPASTRSHSTALRRNSTCIFPTLSVLRIWSASHDYLVNFVMSHRRSPQFLN
jgi:hypothetical protein